MRDLLAFTAELVDIASVSHHEEAIADYVEALLRGVPWLTIDRVGKNVVARTQLARDQRLVLAGHLDTVPANGNERARIEGDVLWGLGSADMKSGCAVILELARTVAEPECDLTYVLYECEEVEARFNGLRRLLAERPELVAGDAAVLCEPTGAVVEAGCQGTLRVAVTLTGERAHTARPWTGTNAIHRLGPLLDRSAAYVGRRPVLDGCEFAEALSAVRVEGGVANNVVPDQAIVYLNHRYAPDRDGTEAFAHLRAYLAPAVDEAAGDTVELVEVADGAAPGLDHPLLSSLIGSVGGTVRAKLGWTDVAFFSAQGIPATNLGPGEPTVAHTASERVERSQVDSVFNALLSLITS